MTRSPAAWIVFAFAVTGAEGQWLGYPVAGTPRTRDGKVNLAAKAPRARNGKPDLTGVWQVEPPPSGSVQLPKELAGLTVPGDDPTQFSKYFLNVLADFKPEEAPLKPAAARILRAHFEAGGTDTPDSRCLPVGLPRVQLLSSPFKIIQSAGVMAVLYEADGSHRQIYTDGRELPKDPQPAWLGYSTGHWEGDTLVVNSAGFNDRTWLDGFGTPHTEAMRLEERFHRRDFGHLDYEVKIEDPETFTRPISFRVTELLLPDSDVLETVCNENERDVKHLALH